MRGTRRALHELETFSEDGVFLVVVESPRGSVLKIKYSPELEAMSVSRPLALGVAYPFDWGFIPSTRGADGDPLDAALWWDVSSYPGVVVPCRALAVVHLEQNRSDGGGRLRNDRVLAQPLAARRERPLTTRVRQEIEHFFVAVTALEGKEARVLGWGDGESALQLIRASKT